jgi:uncharacterized protein (TIGR02145 family)
VELLIVIVVIAILAAITIVAYNGIANRARETALQSDLQGAGEQLSLAQITDGNYPADVSGITKSGSTTFSNYQTDDDGGFCLQASRSDLAGESYFITERTSVQSGTCPTVLPADTAMQTITTANCPATRTRAVDARDNHTYWVKKIGSLCWMLTDLAYSGGGTNTYSDTKTLSNGTSDTTLTYTTAKYYVVPGSGTNYTTKPTNPSTSTTGTGQVGYLYNWCAAMGVQSSKSACLNATSPASSVTTSVCPAGWRLPTGGTSAEFVTLNNTVNGGSLTSDLGVRSIKWLGQQAGYIADEYGFVFGSLAADANYWSSTQQSAGNAYEYYYDFEPDPADAAVWNEVNPTANQPKKYGGSVRCVAA